MARVGMENSPIYLIPGMTTDYPVYSRLLPILPNASVVDYLPPKDDEPLVDYAWRMASGLRAQSYLVGVSFGGIVALEIARILRPRGCVLISSIRHPCELPPWFRVWRLFGGRNCGRWLRFVGGLASLTPRSVRSVSTMRAAGLAGRRGSWHRWATAAVIDWQPSRQFDGCPLLQIHGTADSTFPIRYTHPDISVSGGQHALPISHPAEIAEAICEFMVTQ